MKSKVQRTESISDLKSLFEKSQAMFLTNLVGVNSEATTSIRKKIRDAEGFVAVSKNTFFAKATEGTYCEDLFSQLKGPNAVAFCFGDPSAVAKIINDFGKDNELVKLKGGYAEKKKMSVAEIVQLANLPSKEVMLASVLATMLAPISSFARVLESIREQKEAGAQV
ncbi:MAG: 50S ribosomal protein L10 [Bacteriovoracaceae bacterium]|nr:50S ribosomal protein L10 [Bacteriovoracaceae bacterium]